MADNINMREIITDRIKKLRILILILFLIIFLSFVKAVLLTDTTKTSLSMEYQKKVKTYYPRGVIEDRNNIRFTQRTDKTDNVNLPSNNNAFVGRTYIGDVKINENNTTKDAVEGISGIQYHYNSLLKGGTPINVYATIDATGSVTGDNSYYLSNDHENEGSTITLTSDYLLQKETEEYFKKYLKERGLSSGAVICQDVKSGEILFMVSVDDSINKTVMSYQPGSVFKIITLAVALEEGVVKETDEFKCSGKVKVGKDIRKCSNEKGHGKINLMEGFAYSCNEVFYRVAEKLNMKEGKNIVNNKILSYTKSIGFGSLKDTTNLNKKYTYEYSDYFSFVPNKVYNKLDTFNLGIGQGNIQSTPLLVNTITAAVANGGETVYPFIIDKITSPTGKSLEVEKKHKYDLHLSKSTCDTLKKTMRMVCTMGTARGNSMEKYFKCAGKTGTAEHIEKREAHSWFTGFFPYDNPKYAMTVFVEEGGAGSVTALSAFSDIAKNVYESDFNK